MENLTPDIQYIVTKASDDGTFEVGDRIKLLSDGAILCIEAKGWIDAEDVPAATEGMECELDQKWAERGREAAIKLLKVLDSIGEED
jgi:hypothetical protein